MHIATVVTPTGSFGGPIRVATNQAEALFERGIDVTFVAGYNGGRSEALHGLGIRIRTRLFRVCTFGNVLGFAGYLSPAMAIWLWRHVREYDVVHVHLARDLVTLVAARIAQVRKVPVILQTHGMIDPSSRWLSKPIDRILTLPVLRNAERVLYLTKEERGSLLAVGGSGLPLAEVINGVPMPKERLRTKPWSQEIEVLYLSRLHPRKRPDLFVRAASSVNGSHLRFKLVGPDQGMLSTVLREIALTADRRISYEGALSPQRTLERISRADVFVLPSVDEPFPMAVLEALSLGIPSIVTRSCGLAPVIAEVGAGLVVDETVEDLAKAISELALNDTLRKSASRAAFYVARSRLSMDSVVSRLLKIYYVAVGEQRRATR